MQKSDRTRHGASSSSGSKLHTKLESIKTKISTRSHSVSPKNVEDIQPSKTGKTKLGKASINDHNSQHSNSSSSGSDAESSRGNQHLTENEKILIKNPYRESSRPRPLHDPLFPFPVASSINVEKLLSIPTSVYGKNVAKWVKKLFKLKKYPKILETPKFTPIRPGAPTILALFYPDPERKMRRPVEVYLKRIENLAKMGEQTIIYVCPTIAKAVKAMRKDPHWYVISEYKTIWDIPTNSYQYNNFRKTQTELFKKLEGERPDWKLNATYNHAHQMAAYNAKAFVTYDAVIRNPFGSDRWIYMDAGLFTETGPIDSQGVLWGDVIAKQLDAKKFDRSIGISGDTGIVIGQYRIFADHGDHGRKDINHEWFSNPRRVWQSQHFAGGAYAGNSSGMLNFAVRYMQTVIDMDANGYYIGREEWIYPMLAVRYPNTIFCVPWVATLDVGKRPNFPMCTCYSTYGDTKVLQRLPAIEDPISTLLCHGYKPRKPNLDGTGPYKKLDKKTIKKISWEERMAGKTGFFEGTGPWYTLQEKRLAKDLEIKKKTKQNS
ncbi:hypothetical protein BELL_1573g00010 [Botrytis elliptica]|uniref:Uncharacterized protein n=1 Tax=Botrytis elliptica TaxID=278938 RepID=A0A4Z1HWQ8_9HELO|nr:hypothetical protein EAE99_002429 [Botrytis elliptica]TGO53659.1 hypothetical protein BELL_1573g00010 [Botrytis elliptica]